jgi:hypothetical protein
MRLPEEFELVLKVQVPALVTKLPPPDDSVAPSDERLAGFAVLVQPVRGAKGRTGQIRLLGEVGRRVTAGKEQPRCQ